VPSDDGVVHISAERVVVLIQGPEMHEVYVSLEQVDRLAPAVRIQGAADAPMTPLQALELAASIQAAAISALMGEGTVR
jgi:hypothetical protein